MRRRKSRRAKDAARELADESRSLTDLGSNLTRGQHLARLALRTLSEADLLEDRDKATLELVADLSLLLGRQIRLIADFSAAHTWLDSAISANSSLLKEGVSPLRLERYLDTLNTQILVHLNAYDIQNRNAQSELNTALNLHERQRSLLLEDHNLHDGDDQYLEMLQRGADVIARTVGAGAATEFLTETGYVSISRRRPEHNFALRLTNLAHLALNASNSAEAERSLVTAQSLEVVKRSNFIQIELHERIARLHRLRGENDLAEREYRIAQGLRELENINAK